MIQMLRFILNSNTFYDLDIVDFRDSRRWNSSNNVGEYVADPVYSRSQNDNPEPNEMILILIQRIQ